MKYTIQQERLAKLIKKYLDSHIGDITPDIEVDEFFSVRAKFWIGEDGLKYFWQGSYSFEIDEELRHNVKNVFPVEDDDFLVDVIIDWFNSSQDFDEIETDIPVDFEDLN